MSIDQAASPSGNTDDFIANLTRLKDYKDYISALGKAYITNQ